MLRQSLAIALVLQFFAFPQFALALQMPDIAYEDAVNSLESAGVIDGYGAGNPRIREYVNRAEALKIILLSRQETRQDIERMAKQLPPISLFPDVDQKAWYAPYIETGFRFGIVKGYPDGRLWPQGGVRVVEAVAMLTRAYHEDTAGAPFRTSDDLENIEGEWFTGPISVILARDGVMPDSRLSRAAYMTRGQLFDMVYRLRIASGETRGGQQTQIIAGSSSSSPKQTPSSPAPETVVPEQVNPEAYRSNQSFALTIPSLDITDLTISHPTDATTQKGVLEPLSRGVGHLFGYPGQGGKVLIYGHSSGYPWDLSKYTKIFRGINKIAIGQKIYVTRDQKVYTYQVTEKRTVLAKDKSAFEPDELGEELILYTCWPPDSITHRFLVLAKPVN